MTRPVYEIKNLTHWYHRDTVVLSIDALSIMATGITGLYGPNGSGKSTLLKILGFIEKPARGELRFNGRPAVSVSRKMRLQTVLMPQKPYLLKRSVYKNLLYGLSIRKDTRDHPRRIRHALTMTGLSFEKFARRKWSDLSGGEIQRVALAARFLLRPDVLLLDEPTSNLDIRSLNLITTALQNAARNHGTTCIIASHDKNWLDEVCDNMVYLFDGKAFHMEEELKQYTRHLFHQNSEDAGKNGLPSMDIHP